MTAKKLAWHRISSSGKTYYEEMQIVGETTSKYILIGTEDVLGTLQCPWPVSYKKSTVVLKRPTKAEIFADTKLYEYGGSSRPTAYVAGWKLYKERPLFSWQEVEQAAQFLKYSQKPFVQGFCEGFRFDFEKGLAQGSR